MAARVLDLDDTSRCPIADVCATCGGRGAPACDMADGCGASTGQPCAPGCPSLATDPDGAAAFLAVATLDTPVGVLCVTLCGPCADAGELPRFGWSGAAMAVCEHCEHLGCDLDEAADARDAQRAAAREVEAAQREPGCDACRVVGPLLVAPGTSGRSWECRTCGTVWSHTDRAQDGEAAQ